MWTEAARKQHAPRKGRYPSDLTDAEWALIEPLIPRAQRGGYCRPDDRALSRHPRRAALGHQRRFGVCFGGSPHPFVAEGIVAAAKNCHQGHLRSNS